MSGAPGGQDGSTVRRLTVRTGPDKGKFVEIDHELVVGREDVEFVINDPEISRRHAKLRPLDRGVEIEDLGSTNGTRVDGERIDGPVRLTSSASIELGTTALDVEIELPPPVAERPPDRPGPELRRTLRVIWGPAEGTAVVVDREIVVGRQDADLTIHDPEVSRRHAVVKPAPTGIVIEDLGSLNGTYVNGEQISGPATLSTASTIRIGNSEIELELYMPGATRVSPAAPATDDRSRTATGIVPVVAAAMQLSKAELVKLRAEQMADIPGQTPPSGRGGPPSDTVLPELPPLPALAGRLGVREQNRRWWTLVAMCVGLGMIMLDTTVVNVALPSIQRDLNTGIEGLEWTINAYTLALAVLLVPGGRLSDIYGRRRLFLIGIVLFALSSIAVGAAQTPTVLYLSRGVQGAAGALIMPATLAILMSVFPPAGRARAIGIWAGVSGIALALGPVVGGVLTEQVSWRAVFYINVPIAALGVLAALVAAPETRDEHADRRIDWFGVVTLTGCLSLLLIAAIRASDWGWLSGRTLAMIGASAVLLVVFWISQLKLKSPLIEVPLFRSLDFIGANLAGFAMFFVMVSMLVYAAIFLQSILGFDALETGVRFLPCTLLLAGASPIAGHFVARVVPQRLVVLGLLIAGAGAVTSTRLHASSSYATMLPFLILVGIGVGACLTPTSAIALAAVRRDKAGAASGLLTMSRQLGATFGVAVVTTVFNSLGTSYIKDNLASLRLPAEVRDTIADRAVAGESGLPPGSGSVSAATLARIQEEVTSGLADAIAGAFYVPTGMAFAGAVIAMLVFARARRRDVVPSQEAEPAIAP